MRVKTKKRPACDIDVSAFADIAFLLIIFFILTTTFNRQQGALLNIPSGTQDESRTSDENPTVNLSLHNLAFRNRVISIPDFRRELQEMNLPDLPVDQRIIVLESTDDVTFEIYFQVVTSISDAGGVLAVMEKEEE